MAAPGAADVDDATSDPSGAGYDTSWARRPAARAARAVLQGTLMRASITALARPERRGLDRLDGLLAERPVPAAIFAANHHSHLDTSLLLTTVPRPWRERAFVGAAADYFFSTPVTSAVSALALNAIPIERTKVDRRSMRTAEELLRDGWSLVLFPEGGRSADGWGQPHKGGVAFLASRTGVPVVPVHLHGTGRILPKGRRLPRPSRTVVTFGEPLRAEPGERTRALTRRIETAVAVLADEVATDAWSARRRAARGETPALTGPDAAPWRRAWLLARRDAEAADPGDADHRWPAR